MLDLLRSVLPEDLAQLVARWATPRWDDQHLHPALLPPAWRGPESESRLEDVVRELGPTPRPDWRPPLHHVFRALWLTPDHHIRVVVCGMDPYPNASAEGLCFSVAPGQPINPSLQRIGAALRQQGYLGAAERVATTGSLVRWAEQGVMLYNAALTVPVGQSGQHQRAWRAWSAWVVARWQALPQPVVWLLWGRPAQRLVERVPDHHLRLVSPHPSPLAGSQFTEHQKRSPHFVLTNEWLRSHGQTPIVW